MGRHAAPRSSRTSRRLVRLRAVLAGGLVLGIGTTATLAAWNDSEYATTTVTASRFGIVGNTNGGAFTEHATSAAAATVTFTPAVATMSPGTTSFATVGIQTLGTSTIGGSVVMSTSTAATGLLAAALTYAVRAIPVGTTCNQAVFDATATPANVIVPNATPLTTAVGANTQSLASAAGNTVTYCVSIALPAGASSSLQGGTAAVTWQFLGTSSA